MPNRIVQRGWTARRTNAAAWVPSRGVTIILSLTGSGGMKAGGSADVSRPTILANVTGDIDAGIAGRSLIRPTVPRQVILAGSRRFSFRYELLDKNNVGKGDLDTVTDATVSMDWLANIKRKLTMTMRDGGSLTIDWLSDRIRPWVRLHLPPFGEDDWVEWPQGVFLLNSPTRSTDDAGTVWRNVSGFDQGQVYADDKVESRYTVAAGEAYTTAVSTLLGSVDATITTSSATLPVAREWDPGTSKLRIINDLLDAIAYESLSFDEWGRAVVRPYVLPSHRPEEFVYADGDSSLMLARVDQELDLFSVANKWVLVVSNADQNPITSIYTNTSASSPTSTVRRGRVILDFRTEEDAADQGALDAKAQRLAFEASQVYEALVFSTGTMPIHSGNDVYRISFSPLAVNGAYAETGWTMPMKIGAAMQHKARRVVSVS